MPATEYDVELDIHFIRVSQGGEPVNLRRYAFILCWVAVRATPPVVGAQRKCFVPDKLWLAASIKCKFQVMLLDTVLRRVLPRQTASPPRNLGVWFILGWKGVCNGNM
jgi:hypothetical protein